MFRLQNADRAYKRLRSAPPNRGLSWVLQDSVSGDYHPYSGSWFSRSRLYSCSVFFISCIPFIHPKIMRSKLASKKVMPSFRSKQVLTVTRVGRQQKFKFIAIAPITSSIPDTKVQGPIVVPTIIRDIIRSRSAFVSVQAFSYINSSASSNWFSFNAISFHSERARQWYNHFWTAQGLK